MKKLLLLSFIVSLNCSAANWMKKSSLESCTGAKSSYRKKAKCQAAESEKCYKLKKVPNCSYDRVKTVDGVEGVWVDSALKSDYTAAVEVKRVRKVARKAARERLERNYDCELQPTAFLKDVCRNFKR